MHTYIDMRNAIQYDGPYDIHDRVITPDGPGYVSALYPPVPYYQGKCVQVTLDTDEFGPLYDSRTGEYLGDVDRLGDLHAYADADLTPEPPKEPDHA